MSLRPIHLMGSAVLRQRAAEVGVVDGEVRSLIADLFDTMRAAKGIGLAANQVGVARRVAVVESGGGEAAGGHSYALVDPVIVEASGRVKDEEGCLSIPEIFADVVRAERVVVEAGDENGVRRRIAATDLLARALQHEIDHLDGILIVDRVGPIKRRFLLRQWEKARAGQRGNLKEVVPEGAAKG